MARARKEAGAATQAKPRAVPRKRDRAGKPAGKVEGSKLYDAIHRFCADFNEEAYLADGYEEALIGVVERCSQPSLACYDAEKCVEILMKRDGMTYEEAQEFFEFNSAGAWCGPNTPVFLRRFHKEDWLEE